jgi:hypothetical protein
MTRQILVRILCPEAKIKDKLPIHAIPKKADKKLTFPRVPKA